MLRQGLERSQSVAGFGEQAYIGLDDSPEPLAARCAHGLVLIISIFALRRHQDRDRSLEFTRRVSIPSSKREASRKGSACRGSIEVPLTDAADFSLHQFLRRGKTKIDLTRLN